MVAWVKSFSGAKGRVYLFENGEGCFSFGENSDRSMSLYAKQYPNTETRKQILDLATPFYLTKGRHVEAFAFAEKQIGITPIWTF